MNMFNVRARRVLDSGTYGFVESTVTPRGPMAKCQQDAIKSCADKTGRELRLCLQSNRPSLLQGIALRKAQRKRCSTGPLGPARDDCRR